MNGTEAAEIRALDRKITDGLNLVYGQIALLREEQRENRQEFRDFRKEIRAELRAEIAKLDARFDTRFAGLEAELRAETAKLDTRLDTRFAGLEAAMRELTAKVSAGFERTSATRRLVWGVLGALGLLFAGAAIRPVLERAVSVLFTG